MEMNMRITGGLLGFVALLIGSQANAATVQVNPASISVGIGGTFQLTVEGVGFPATVGGGFILDWDSSALTLNTSEASVLSGLNANGWDISSADTSNPGQLVVLASTFGAGQAGAFDLVTLDFVANLPGLTIAGLGLNPIEGPTGNWTDPLFNQNIVVDYTGATVTVNTVPVPAAVWLFGSGLLGMIGIARRRSPQLG